VLGLVPAGFQRYYANALSDTPHECLPIEDLLSFISHCCESGITASFELPAALKASDLPSILQDCEKWKALAHRFSSDSKKERGNRTYPKGFTTLNMKTAYINGGHPELSTTDIPSDVEREYRDFIVAALQYLTANSPTGTEARGGLHFAYQLAPDNRYEAYALGLFEGTLISHVDFFNDWRSGHDEMGALSYTFTYKGRPLRASIFAYPRLCVGNYLSNWTSRWGGRLSDFNHTHFPSMPERVEEQKAVFRTRILEVAKVILSREYPTTGTLATLPAFERPSHCRLDFIGSNISVYFYNPGVRALVGWDLDSWKSQPEEPDIWRRRLCLCLCAAQCSCPTVGMGCSLSLPDAMREGMTASDMLRWMIRFHLSVRSSHEANAKWCQWGDFVPPERGQKGQAATYDRYQRTHGMLQDLDRYIRDEPDRAEKLVSTLSLYVSTLTYKLENPRYELNATLDAFRNQLKKLAVGFSALQTASFVVNLHQYGFFDRVHRAHLYTLVNGVWSGVGGGSQNFLRTAGFESCEQLRAAVLALHGPIPHYGLFVHVLENMPCEIKRYLMLVYCDRMREGELVLDWHPSRREIKYVPVFGLPCLKVCDTKALRWADVDPVWSWPTVEARWRNADRTRRTLPTVS
jgi:hypothetical protein